MKINMLVSGSLISPTKGWSSRENTFNKYKVLFICADAIVQDSNRKKRDRENPRTTNLLNRTTTNPTSSENCMRRSKNGYSLFALKKRRIGRGMGTYKPNTHTHTKREKKKTYPSRASLLCMRSQNWWLRGKRRGGSNVWANDCPSQSTSCIKEVAANPLAEVRSATLFFFVRRNQTTGHKFYVKEGWTEGLKRTKWGRKPNPYCPFLLGHGYSSGGIFIQIKEKNILRYWFQVKCQNKICCNQVLAIQVQSRINWRPPPLILDSVWDEMNSFCQSWN